MENQPMTEVTNNDKIWAALCYPTLGALGIITLFMEDKKNQPFIKYHAVQSIAFNVVVWLIAAILSAITFGIGAICIFPLAWLSTLWPAYGAYNGKYVELPVITNILKQQKWIG